MRRIIIFILSLSLILTVPAMAEESVQDSFEPTAKLQNAVNLLTSTNAEIDLPAEHTQNVSRAQFLTTLVDLFLVDWQASKDTSPFADVESAELKYITNVALSLDIISPNENYYPDQPITYTEALKMVVVATGHDKHAKHNGGYPSGYISIAHNLKLTDGIALGLDEPMTSEFAYLLFRNMLESDVIVIRQMNLGEFGDDYHVVLSDEATFIETYYGWGSVDGIVDGNSITGLYDSGKTLADGQISVNGISFSIDNVPLLGSHIKGFYKDEDSTNDIVYYEVDDNSSLVIYSTEDPILVGNRLEYESNKHKRHATLEPFYSVIYNGKAYDGFVENDVEIESGTVTLVDSNNNSKYDVMIIMDGTVANADIVNVNDNAIKDTYLGLTYDLRDANTYRILSDGRQITLNSVSAGTPFIAYVSKDGQYTELHMLTQSISGEVQYVTDETLTINDTEYVYSSYFANRYYPNLSTKKNYTFVLTDIGTLAVVVNNSSDKAILAYMYKVWRDESEDNTIYARVFTENGEKLILTFDEKVVVYGGNNKNGIGFKDSRSLFAYLSVYGDGSIVRYKLSKDGYANKLWLPENVSTQDESLYDPTVDNENVLRPYIVNGISDSEQVYYKSFGLFIPFASIDSSTKVFIVDETEGVSESVKYKIGSMGSWNNDSKHLFGAIHMYNVSKSCHADILVMKEAVDPTINEDGAKGGVIESVSRSMNKDDELSLKIVVGSDNSYTTLYLPESHSRYVEALNTSAGTDLASGDFIVYTCDSLNNIITYRKDFDYGTKKIGATENSSGDNSVLVYYFGKLSQITNMNFGIELTDSSTATKKGRAAIVYMSEFIWFMDVKQHTASGISYAQMANYAQQDYDILVRERHGGVSQIVVYAKEQ